MRLYWIYFITSGIVGVLFAILQWPLWVLITILIFICIAHICYSTYIYYFSKNLIRIEKYIKGYKHNPYFQYALSLKYGTHQDQLQALDYILTKYKKPSIQAHYKILRAVMIKDYHLARIEAARLQNNALQQHALAFIAAHEGKQGEAANYELYKPWMIPFIEAILALQEHNFSDFKKAKSSSIRKATGIQRFINAWYFRVHEDE